MDQVKSNHIERGERLEGKILCELAPFVRLDKLRAGDVMLTRGRGIESGFIALLGGGQFSHASIWLPQPNRSSAPELGSPRGQLSLLEADDYGVGFGLVNSFLLSIDEKTTYHVASLSQVCGTPIMLLRHPRLSEVNESVFDSAVKRLAEEEQYRHYASLHRLLGASVLPPILQKAVGLTITPASYLGKHPSDKGSFCSELVAKFFAQVSLPLFEIDKSPELVSPNHLAPGVSVLVEEPDAFVLESQIINNAFAECCSVHPEWMSRNKLLPAMTNSNASHKKFVKDIQAVETKVFSSLRNSVQSSRHKFRQIHCLIRDQYYSDRPFETKRSKMFSRNLFLRSCYLLALDDGLRTIEAEPELVEDLPKFHASLRLRNILSRSAMQLSHENHRHQLLYALLLHRVKPLKNQRRELRKHVNIWRDTKMEFLSLKTMIAQPFGSDTPLHPDGETLCSQHIRIILDTAAQLARNIASEGNSRPFFLELEEH
jgi:hypothetical protein